MHRPAGYTQPIPSLWALYAQLTHNDDGTHANFGVSTGFTDSATANSTSVDGIWPPTKSLTSSLFGHSPAKRHLPFFNGPKPHVLQSNNIINPFIFVFTGGNIIQIFLLSRAFLFFYFLAAVWVVQESAQKFQQNEKLFVNIFLTNIYFRLYL